jgi:ATP-dependent NAD(P)H-hydrate dehydratase
MKSADIRLVLILSFILYTHTMIIKIRKIATADYLSRGSDLIPKLSTKLHKGQLGRIGVIGGKFERLFESSLMIYLINDWIVGSLDYTGAPYYASQSALKFGADLAFVFCAKQAMIPIKSYSPELMVTSFYDAEVNIPFEVDAEIDHGVERIIGAFPRLHVLVIGPGLGRDHIPMEIIQRVIVQAKEINMPMVIDADGLFVISKNLSLIQNYTNCILTPNAAELDRLAKAIIAHMEEIQQIDSGLLHELSSPSAYRVVAAVSRYLGNVTIVRKGFNDLVSNGEHVYEIEACQSPRRCGGQVIVIVIMSSPPCILVSNIYIYLGRYLRWKPSSSFPLVPINLQRI